MYDFVIIGGGIIGMSTAMQLIEIYPDARITLLEKEAGPACHQTGHNSGVIHAGVYYTPGSLKAQFCLAGNRATKAFCEQNGIRYDVCGKMLVATSPLEMERMRALWDRTAANGLQREWLSAGELREREPNITGLGGIFVPSSGIVSYRDNRSFVMADIPGIIEGASEGRGLGLRFLRHIERNAVLLFMVPADADDITAQYEVLLNELEQFNPQLMDKHRILAISKSDMLDDELMEEIKKTLPADVPHVFISAVTGYGLTELKDTLWRAITDDSNRMATPDIVHRPLDGHHRVREEDEFIFENVPVLEEDEDFEGEDLRTINPDEWDEEYDWDEDIEPEESDDSEK